MNTDELLTRFRVILERGGVNEALRFLNGTGPHRFTAVYRREADVMRNLYFVDREDPSVTRSDDIPLDATYCQFALRGGALFQVADATRDPRLTKHPARDQVRSYCGVPLLNAHGESLGTLCSFDYAPQPDDSVDLEFYIQLPALLERHGLI